MKTIRIEDNLRIRKNGELYHKDGKDVKEYLAAWVKEQGLRGGTPVNLICRTQLQRLKQDAELTRCWGA